MIDLLSIRFKVQLAILLVSLPEVEALQSAPQINFQVQMDSAKEHAHAPTSYHRVITGFSSRLNGS